MEPEKLQEIVSNNRDLEQKLTKRNEQYIFDLNKSMNAANFSEEEKALGLHEVLPALVEGQKKGTTARQLFGTVSECMDMLINKPKEMKRSKPTLMWLDNSLVIMAMIAIMTGVMALFFKQSAGAQYGLATLFIGSAVGGWVMYLMYKYFYQYEQPGADKSKKPKFWKAILLMVPAVFLWFVAFSGSAFLLPPVINPIVDPVIQVVIGGAAYLIHYYLKKQYGVVGMFGSRPQPEPDQRKK